MCLECEAFDLIGNNSIASLIVIFFPHACSKISEENVSLFSMLFMICTFIFQYTGEYIVRPIKSMQLPPPFWDTQISDAQYLSYTTSFVHARLSGSFLTGLLSEKSENDAIPMQFSTIAWF